MLPELKSLKTLLLNEWDPIGVSGLEGAEDEYDSYALRVFLMLLIGADTSAIADYLTSVVTKRMCLPANPAHDLRIAEKAVLRHSNQARVAVAVA